MAREQQAEAAKLGAAIAANLKELGYGRSLSLRCLCTRPWCCDKRAVKGAIVAGAGRAREKPSNPAPAVRF